MEAKEKILDESKRLEIFLTKNKSLFEAKREKYFEIQEKQRSRGFIEKALFTDGNEIQMEKKDLGKLKESMDLYRTSVTKICIRQSFEIDCKFRK